MSRWRGPIIATAAVTAGMVAAGVMVAGAGGAATTPPRPAGTVLAGSAVPFAGRAQATGNVPGSRRLSIQVWLRPDTAAAERFAAAVAAPGGPQYRHYLSPAAYTARFGATSGEVAAVESWLRGQGFTAVHTGPQRSYVRATATVSHINAAFRVRLRLYKPTAQVNAGPYPLRGNDRALSIPAALAASVLGVTGLDNAAPVQPLSRPRALIKGCSHYYGQHIISGLPGHFGTTSFPTVLCGYTASQLREAYRDTAAGAGAGQTVALVEQGLTKDMFLTLQDYAKANGMPAPSPQRYAELSLGKNTCGDPFDIEEQLDVEASYDMAPGANQLVVGGDSCDTGDFGLQGLFDADIAILAGDGGHPLATIASNSWESGPDDGLPAFLVNIAHAYLVRAAAEGVGMYFSSGDGPGTYSPASDPFAIAVGGTSLGLGQAGHRLFETGWSTGLYSVVSRQWEFNGLMGGTGGGPSPLWKEPAYQRGVVPTRLSKVGGNRGRFVRSVPDISADADPITGMLEGALTFRRGHPPAYGQFDIGGTSLSAPLVAGAVAAAQQGQPSAFGFINPALYKLEGTQALFDPLPLTAKSPVLDRATGCAPGICLIGGPAALLVFDYQSENATSQVTLPGYDNMTGTGTPDEPALAAALRPGG